VIGVRDTLDTAEFEEDMPGWAHPAPVQRVARGLEGWIWWRLPVPRSPRKSLEELIDFAAPCDDDEKRHHNLKLIKAEHYQRLRHYVDAGVRVFPGYKRTRGGRQVLELRFDGLAGCLRTPEGGSSRQLVVLWREGTFETRLLTIGEVALLMGAKSSYRLPGSYNDAYKAMGDAVAVPVVAHLARHVLAPLAAKIPCD
jgi:DNA (cytosine-5)-methyltransferase 1